MRRFLLPAALALSFTLPAAASAQTIMLGIKGDTVRFQSLTGQTSQVHHLMIGWAQGQLWGSPFSDLFQMLGGVPMLGLDTTRNGKEAITPQQIALGKGDEYFLALNASIAAFGQEVYIRPFGEMNGWWNAYCAFTKAGAVKPGHQTMWFRKAFQRIYLIVHGGALSDLDARLKALGMPPVAASADLAVNPPSTTHVVWNPQGFGSPDIPGNSAQAYYPGDRYVDVVGDDLYDQKGKAEWDAATALYKAHPSKPFSFPEWGLWGIDDPAFVKKMAVFVRSHPRTTMIAYFESVPGSVFDLATKPLSRAAYRRYITPLGG